MKKQEIEQYLSVSRGHSVLLDVYELPELPGYLRTVLLSEKIQVTIEYLSCSQFVNDPMECGSPKWVGKYSSLEEAIEDLERYFGRRIEAWTNYSRVDYYPKNFRIPNLEEINNYFLPKIKSGFPLLPQNGNYKIMDIYWRHIQLFGEFRQDKLGEECELL